ncbi:hypothetical protein [Bifidobacterium mongoliense]|uniref:hypothetical protein n=1 Tax=Bifidobacterium mongoliense TaxID=518643 RepID=UPI002A7573CE|nr:hypothetical protein [Bifidobacterium mongoliense]
MSANAATSIVVSGARCDDLDRVRDEGKWRGEAELIMPRLFHGMATFRYVTANDWSTRRHLDMS